MFLRHLIIAIAAAFCLVGCVNGDDPLDDGQQSNQNSNQINHQNSNQINGDAIDYDALRDALRLTLDDAQVDPIEAPTGVDDDLADLGHQLFFDPLLSGSRDTNCATCHLTDEGTSDSRPLSIGTGAVLDDFGQERPGPQLALTVRNSIDLFHRGSEDLKIRFWDGRLERLDDGRIVMHERSYSKVEGTYLRIMPETLDSLLAAQVMFPVLSRDELRGIHGSVDIFGDENELALVPDHDLEGAWKRLMERIVAIPEYRDFLQQIYPDQDVEDLGFAHAANALAAFITREFSPDDSPFDRFLRGDDEALDKAQLRGADLFYGKANCASCHGGTLMTDQGLHNLAVPPMTRGPDSLMNMDLGATHRSHAGGEMEFHFRTPPLRNVELTAPYMHNGAYPTLERVIRHKIDPLESLWNFDDSHLDTLFYEQVHVAPDSLARVEVTYSQKADLVPALSDEEIADLVAFLESLTSPGSADLTDLQLSDVPSGLPVPQSAHPTDN